MNERLQSIEMNDNLRAATSDVKRHYVENYIRGKNGYPWEEVAQRHPLYREKIIEFGMRMEIVKEVKSIYPKSTADEMIKSFWNIKDLFAENFLGDVLLSRISTNDYRIDHSIDYKYEVAYMAYEMGLTEGWDDDEARKITITKALRKVLEGDLQIAHQRQWKQEYPFTSY